MDLIVEFKLDVTFVETGETQIINLPTNEDIFQLFNPNCPEIIYIVDCNGSAQPALAFITVVDQNNNVSLI